MSGGSALLVSKDDRPYWFALLVSLGYVAMQQHEVFARFKPNEIAAWPIDLMFVQRPIVDQMLAEALMVDFGSVSSPIPSVRHMVALKLHALKQRQQHREEKDFLDIKRLIDLAKISDEELRQLCVKYDRIDVYERLKK